MNHTPEPWHVDRYGDVRDTDGNPVGLYRPVNKRRIVACVNACKGLPTELLESLEHGLIPTSDTAALYRARADDAEADLAEAVGLLRDMAHDHRDTCQAFMTGEPENYPCDCGYKAAHAFLAGQEQKR